MGCPGPWLLPSQAVCHGQVPWWMLSWHPGACPFLSQVNHPWGAKQMKQVQNCPSPILLPEDGICLVPGTCLFQGFPSAVLPLQTSGQQQKQQTKPQPMTFKSCFNYWAST